MSAPPYVFNVHCTCGAALDALQRDGRPARYEDHSTTRTCPAVDCTDSYPHDGDPCPTCGRSSAAAPAPGVCEAQART